MNIYESMGKVMDAIAAVPKDSTNPKQGYKYRSIDAVMNAINPALTKYHVFITPEVTKIEREERRSTNGGTLIYSVVTVKYTFFAEDSTSVSCVTMGEGMDSGDKSLNKAMSAAYKYALFQVFCIPTEEMHDSSEDSPEPAPQTDTKGTTTSKSQVISQEQIEKIESELKRTNVSATSMLKKYNVSSINAMTQIQAEDALKKFNQFYKKEEATQ